MEGVTTLGMANATFKHQNIIANILINYFIKYGNDIEVLPTPSVDKKDLKTVSPDIAFFEVGEQYPSVVIEIEHKKEISRTEKKLPIYFSAEYQDIKEIFLYLYDKQEWRVYHSSSPNDYTLNSFSNYLEIDLNELIFTPMRPAPSLSGTPTHPQKPIVLL